VTSGTQLVTILTTWISLALLLIVVFRLWSSLRLDAFRQSMFALRDEMFDYAASGNIAFNDPAYSLLRKSMNGFIRYAHNLTFFRVILVVFYWKMFSIQPETKWWNSWDEATSRLPNEVVQRDLRCFHHRAMQLVARRLVLGSPFLMTLLIFVVCHHGILSLAEALVRSLGKFIDPKLLEEEAAKAAA
jgi:hypothetical protein